MFYVCSSPCSDSNIVAVLTNIGTQDSNMVFVDRLIWLQAVFQICIDLMRIRIQLFRWTWIRIQLWKWMRIHENKVKMNIFIPITLIFYTFSCVFFFLLALLRPPGSGSAFGMRIQVTNWMRIYADTVPKHWLQKCGNEHTLYIKLQVGFQIETCA
jgi:hypothetical protein